MGKKKPETQAVTEVFTGTATQIKNYLVGRYLADSERVKEGKEARTSHILIGPPGIGKTRAVMEAGLEIAKRTEREFLVYDDREFFDLWTGNLTELGRKVLAEPDKFFVNVVFPLNLAEPTDLTGIPQVVGDLGVTRFYPHFWVKVCSVTPGFLVLDDFLDTQREDVLSAGYRVILDKVLGFLPLHRDRVVVATSNTPEHSSLSRLMPVPLATRWEVHSISTPAVDEWAGWMDRTFGDRWDKRTYAFLKAFEADQAILRIPPEPETSHPYPCPRSWTELARALHFGPADMDGLIGPEWGQKFRAFLDTRVDIEALMREPEAWKELQYDSKCMAVCMLSSWMKKGDVKGALPLVKAMAEDSKEFVALLARLCPLDALIKLVSTSTDIKGVADEILEARKKLIGL